MDLGAFYPRRGVAILVVAVALLPVIAWGVYRAIRSNANDVRDWLPPHYVETRQYAWFVEHFGPQDFIIASWPGCTLEDGRLDEFARRIEELSQGPEGSRLFSRVITGRSLLDQLAAPPWELDRARAVARLRGSIIGPDGQQTCAAITLREEAAERLKQALALIEEAAAATGIARDQLQLGGIPVVNDAINRESTQSLMRLAGLSGVLGVLIAWLCFRDVWLTSLILITGVYSAAASLALVPLFGVQLNAILITMVPLVYVTAISGAIHLSNYYLDATRHVRLQNAPGSAVAHALVPLCLAATTTLLGLLSLCYSDLHPICLFGLFSAIGVAVGALAQFLLLPAALAVWTPLPASLRGGDSSGPRPEASQRPEILSGPGEPHREVTAETAHTSSHLEMWPRLGEAVIARREIMAAICLGAALVAGLGLPRIRTSIQMMRLFRSDAPVVPMTRWLEEKLGATIPLELVLRFKPASNTTMLNRIQLVGDVDIWLRQLPQATGSISAATFSPPQLNAAARSGFVRRAVANARLKQHYMALHEHGWVARDGEDEMWRISLRVRGIDDLDYVEFARTLRQEIGPVLDHRLGPGRPGVDLIVTGTAPIVFQARQSLLDGMLFGLATDVALIVIGVLLITRSWLTAGLMLILSIFPTTLVFGTMGLLGIVVDIGSVMTPCVAVGVTVDDVIHFLLCFRRGVREGLTSEEATLLAHRTCGRAMVQSWGVIGIGLAAFALSSFVPIFRFGMLMLLLLTAGLAGNLLLLPALLAGPVGRWIAREPIPMASLDDA